MPSDQRAGLPDPDGFEVADGYTYVGAAMGDRVVEDGVIRIGRMGLFSCDSCGAVVSDQALHDRWHKYESQTASDARVAAMRTRRLGGRPMKEPSQVTPNRAT